MTEIEFAVALIQRSGEMMKGTLNDFSDADMLQRPCPGANHAAWQLGHLTNSEANTIRAVNPSAAVALPEGWAEKFKKSTASIDDPKAFPSKVELLATFSKVRAGTIAWAKSLKPADFDQPAPERMRAFAPTIGALVGIIPMHLMMHMGQFQVIRRKLGKPVLM